MAETRKDSIQTEAFVNIDGIETNLSTLLPQKKNEVAALLKAAWLNARFDGKASFCPGGEESGLSFPTVIAHSKKDKPEK